MPFFGVLFNLPPGTTTLANLGETASPLFDELAPLVWWGGGLIAGAGIVVLIFTLIYRVFWGR